jgi:LeuA-like protein with dimerisation domain
MNGSEPVIKPQTSASEPATKPETSASGPDVRQWSLRRVDIRSPVRPDSWPVVRIELDHPERGKVTDIATAPGAFDAAFLALGQIVGVKPRLLNFSVRTVALTEEESLRVLVEVQLELEGQLFVGESIGLDLTRCAVEAWLSAISSVSSDAEIPSYARQCRRFQVTGVDCNDDLWIYASCDEGAAEAIAKEFHDEEYSEVAIIR